MLPDDFDRRGSFTSNQTAGCAQPQQSSGIAVNRQTCPRSTRRFPERAQQIDPRSHAAIRTGRRPYSQE